MDEALLVQLHIHHRRTGVTSSLENILPDLSKSYEIVWYGNHLNTTLPKISFVNLYRRIKESNKKNKKVIIHSHRNNEILFALVLRFLRCKFRLIATRHSATKASGPTRILFGLADARISLNQQASNNLDLPSTIIPHGIDISKFPLKKSSPDSLGIKAKHIIGVVGRIRELKGQKDLVNAALEVLKDYADWDVVFLGQAKKKDQAYLSEIKSAISGRNMNSRFHFPGEVNDPLPYYNIFDIVVIASYSEGGPLVSLEAMATGSAVIATENVGTNSLVVSDGENGFLYTPGDVKQLAAKLSILLMDSSKLKLFQSNGRKSIEDKWPVSVEVEGIKGVYESAESDR